MIQMETQTMKVLMVMVIIYLSTSLSMQNEDPSSVDDSNIQNVFCWKVNGKSSTEGNNHINNILWKNQSHFLSAEESKATDNGRGIACSRSDLPKDYISSNCWALKRQNPVISQNTIFIRDILHQFYPDFESSTYMDLIFNNTEPICLIATVQACDSDVNIVQLKFDFQHMNKLEMDSFAFERIYQTSNFKQNENSIKICFLSYTLVKLITCSEQPYIRPVFKFPVIFKRQANKVLTYKSQVERNPICIPTSPTLQDREVYSTPPEMTLIYSIFHGISLIFLLLYIFECFIFPKFKTYPRILILWLVISIFISRSLAIVLLNLWIPSNSPTCFVLVYIYRTFLLAIYCCFATASFDLWNTLRTSSNEPPSRFSKTGRLRKYAIFAWGIPVLLASIDLITEWFAPDSTDFHFKYWRNSCVYWSKVTQNLFYSIPTALILFTNCFFFISAYIKLKEMKSLLPIRNRNKKLAVILLRIAVLCGFPWIMSLAADITHLYCDTTILYYIAIVVCSFQAFLILLFFGCQKESREKLKKKITLRLKGHYHGSPATSDVTSSDLTTDVTNIPVYILQNSVKFPYKTNIL